MLTGKEILRRVKEGTIEITDFDESRLNPNSYNLRLGNEFLMYSLDQYSTETPICWYNNGVKKERAEPNCYLDSKQPNDTFKYTVGNESGIILYPNKLYLAHTMETTWAKDLVPCISGRSSFARLGVEIHKTAGFGDIGVRLQWTLEIEVVYPVRLYPGQEICQIYFEEPVGDTEMQYHGKYQLSKGVKASKSFLD